MEFVPLHQEFARQLLVGGPDALLWEGEFCHALVMAILSTDNI